MTKTEADYLLTLSIYWLNQNYFLRGYRSGTISWTGGFADTKSSIGVTVDVRGRPFIQLNYTQTDTYTGEKKTFDYKINLTSTDCHFGGCRWWFICPLTVNGLVCRRRVASLYKEGDYFGCRHCYDLTYHSRHENSLGKWQEIFKSLELEQKADELEAKIKRRVYAGKPTKKQIKLHKLHARISEVYNGIGFRKLQ